MGAGMSDFVIGDQMRKMKADLEAESNDLSKLIERTVKNLNTLKNATLDIAITGKSGAGKSSFVNALRGINNDDEGAAETGPTQTTMESKAYSHPLLPKVTIWDLPGIGTPEFQATKYLQMVNFETYDFFVIVSSERFTNHDVYLGREIHKMHKKFYYVRSKIDQDIANEGRKRTFNKGKTLENIRKDCCDHLIAEGESDPRVFLISAFDLGEYDFPLLVDILGNDLDEFKRHVLITMVSNSSRAILKKKKAAMEDLVWKVALVSSVTGAVPVPGLFFVCNIPFLEATIKDFSIAFGLDEDSLCRLANQVHKPVSMLSSAIRKTRIANRIDGVYVEHLLNRICTENVIKQLAIDFIEFIPVLGSLFGKINSLSGLSCMLYGFLNDAQEDAEKVWERAFAKSEPQTQ